MRPEHQLRGMIPRLKKLREGLQRASAQKDSLRGIVDFFNVVSSWHDQEAVSPYDSNEMPALMALIWSYRDADYGQHREIIEYLKTLRDHIFRAGRNQYGMNRTQRGETVTENNVWLGNVYGLWTNTVAFWRITKNESKGGWGYPGMEQMNAYDVMFWQAREFMDSHVAPMVAIIRELEIIAA